MGKELLQKINTAAQRAYLRGLGYRDEELARPLIAIIGAASQFDCGTDCKNLYETVQNSVSAAGGTPVFMPFTSFNSAFAVGNLGGKYAIPFRDITADAIESILTDSFDGAVIVGGGSDALCGLIIGALRVNIPTLFLSAGISNSEMPLSQVFSACGKSACGNLTPDELKTIEQDAYAKNGYNGGKMNCVAEALGLSVVGSGAAYAGTAKLLSIARQTGTIVNLAANSITPKMIVTRDSIMNALALETALGANTNIYLNILAIAEECGIKDIGFQTINELNAKVPTLLDGITKLDQGGGVMAVLKLLSENGLLFGNPLTVADEKLKTIIENAQINASILNYASPISPTGAVTVLGGNIAEEGCFVRKVRNAKAQSYTAKVFDSEEAAFNAALNGKIKSGMAVVVRYEGARSGMRDITAFTSYLEGLGLESSVAVITDGRISNYGGICVGYVSPEAAAGGNIALIYDGDKLDIDLSKNKINIDINAKEVNTRIKKLVLKNEEQKGLLARYAANALPAERGAGLKKG